AQERNAAYDLIDWANGHQNGQGIQALFAGESLYGSASLSAKDQNDVDGESVKQFNARGVFAPMHEAGNVLHFGVNYAQRDLSDTAFDGRIRSRLRMRGVSTDGGQDAGANGNRLVLAGASNTPAGAFDNTAPGAWKPHSPPVRYPSRANTSSAKSKPRPPTAKTSRPTATTSSWPTP